MAEEYDTKLFMVSVNLFIDAESEEAALRFAREMLTGQEMMTRHYDIDTVEPVS